MAEKKKKKTFFEKMEEAAGIGSDYIIQKQTTGGMPKDIQEKGYDSPTVLDPRTEKMLKEHEEKQRKKKGK